MTSNSTAGPVTHPVRDTALALLLYAVLIPTAWGLEVFRVWITSDPNGLSFQTVGLLVVTLALAVVSFLPRSAAFSRRTAWLGVAALAVPYGAPLIGHLIGPVVWFWISEVPEQTRSGILTIAGVATVLVAVLLVFASFAKPDCVDSNGRIDLHCGDASEPPP